LPTVRLANLMHLRQPASVDLYVDEVLQHARVIVVDHLGGESYWPYGTERIREVCRQNGIVLVMFSGDTTEDLNLLQKHGLRGAMPQHLALSARRRGGQCARDVPLSVAQLSARSAAGAGAAPAAVRSGVPPAHDAATAAHWLEPGLGSGRPARPW
jgi:cobaltochelatase CobN